MVEKQQLTLNSDLCSVGNLLCNLGQHRAGLWAFHHSYCEVRASFLDVVFYRSQDALEKYPLASPSISSPLLNPLQVCCGMPGYSEGDGFQNLVLSQLRTLSLTILGIRQ